MNSPWSSDILKVLSHFNVDPQLGLDLHKSELSLKNWGFNVLSKPKKKSRLGLFFKQLKNPVVYILVVSSIIAFVLSEKLDGWAILSIVILNSIIGYLHEAKAEASLEALSALTTPKTRVLRDGKSVLIESKLIVPGDILIFEAGDYVAADARVFSAHQLMADESILTGESTPVTKVISPLEETLALADRVNMVFASTVISGGSGRAVVTHTGEKTEIGKISEMMDSTEVSHTPLQKRLQSVSNKLILLGICVVVLVVIIEFLKGSQFIEIVMTALSLSIAAIPEGLPTVVTLALVMGIRRMSKKKALVRKLDSVETLGATDIICTDKTGTLTTGHMVVREFFTLDLESERLVHPILIMCNNASLEGGGNGDSTEVALLEFAAKKVSTQDLHKRFRRIYEWSFDSVRKRMSVAVQNGDSLSIFVKGAPESILSQCALTDENSKTIHEKIEVFSQQGMRVLALAFKHSEDMVFDQMSADKAESGLTFIGLVALADPPREESSLAIKRCLSAGVQIIMITGDHPQTAGAIARELGIINQTRSIIMTGAQMDLLSDEQLKETSDKIAVFARVSPAHKLRLVHSLKDQGHIVAMTGDGVNDAPALKAASVGIAMGKEGTEVARQAASIILTDDNFSTIVDALEEGRSVNGNIKRSLQYLLSTNFAELLFILGASAIGWPVPFLPINILWVNLVTDGLPALALATEKTPKDFLSQSREPSAKSFFDKAFYLEMALVGLVITVMSLVIYHYSFTHYDQLTARSIAFSFLVYVILFRSLASRSDTLCFFELDFNVSHLMSVLIPLVFQLGMQQSEFFLSVFKIKSLSLQQNAVLIVLSIIPLILLELKKLLKRSSIA